MKCEKCNNREVTFFYSADINGEKTELHLCADCAREEGYGGALDFDLHPAGMFESFFDDFFGDFFAPQRAMLSAFDGFGSPFGRMMAPRLTIPRVNIVVGDANPAAVGEESETKIPADAGEEVRRRRELDALRQQLDEAVKAEDFEKAITLRDQIKGIEKAQ